jgi:hypothetical protein
MNFWQTITSNQIANVVFLAWFVAQALKVPLSLIETKKIDFSRFVGSGGMPSSHSAAVVSLVTMVGKTYGIADPIFAITLTFTLIVMYDASGVRLAAGKQAAVLNKMMDNWKNKNPEFWGGELKELIGHTPLQVIMGAALGLVIAMLMPA